MGGVSEIRKYEVPYGEGWAPIPPGADLLHVHTQRLGDREAVFVWARVDPNEATEAFPIGYFATGEEIPENSHYVGTAHSQDGAFVWHVLTQREGEG